MASKVHFNLKNVHYSVLTTGGYGTPVAIPGAVNLTADPTGDATVFWADGIQYYKAQGNTGYEGTLEMALIPDTFRTSILGESLDSKSVLVENSDVPTVNFALGFQIDGDDESTYFWYYNCTASRPTNEAQTTEESKEVQTETLNWSCAPDSNGIVRTKTTSATTSSTINSWFNAVYQTS